MTFVFNPYPPDDEERAMILEIQRVMAQRGEVFEDRKMEREARDELRFQLLGEETRLRDRLAQMRRSRENIERDDYERNQRL